MSKATFLLITRFALQNTTSNSVEKKESSPRGRNEKRGLGEIPSRPSEYKKRTGFAVLLVQSRTSHKSFLFLLEEKSGAPKSKIVKKTFLRSSEVFERRWGWLSTLIFRNVILGGEDRTRTCKPLRAHAFQACSLPFGAPLLYFHSSKICYPLFNWRMS